MNQPAITTSKIPKETEQQYTAWLLYCEYGSIDKLLKTWEGVALKRTETAPELAGLIERLGNPPCRRSLADWSKKYCWVERRELKLKEDLEILLEKTRKIIRYKKHRIAETFERIINKRIKQLKDGEMVTTLDLKQAWEMLQVEIGKPTSRAELKSEPGQRLLTPEEKEHGKKLHEAVKWYLNQSHKQQKNIEKNNKTE